MEGKIFEEDFVGQLGTHALTQDTAAADGAARHEFTLRHLVKRKFSPSRVEEAVLGPTSLAACLNRQLEKVKCMCH